jgi:hypothetical protein
VLGTSRVITSASRSHFFATAPSARVRETEGLVLTATGDCFHAKAMGTTVTACGLLATSWPKIWDKPFYTSLGPNCPQCTAVVANAIERPAKG